MLPDLSHTNTISIDTETSGLDLHKDYIVGFVLTTSFRPEESFYYPIRHEGGANLAPKPVIHEFKKLLKRTNLRVIMHHAAFDLWMLSKDGIEVNGPIEDTMINDPLINENNRGYGLAKCCQRADDYVQEDIRSINHSIAVAENDPDRSAEIIRLREQLAHLTRVEAKRAEPMYEHLASIFGGEANRDQMANYWRLAGDDGMAVDYAKGDGTSTLQLWKWQQGELDRQDLRRVWQVECDLIPVLHRARVRGVRIDEKELEKVSAEVDVMREEASAAVGGINPRAPKEVGPYLENLATEGGKHDWDPNIIPFPPRTKPSKRFPGGQVSYNAKYLEKFDAGAAINAIRELEHMKNSFIIPMQEKHLYRGRIHSTFHQMASDDYGTVTGRLSSSGPNLQQVTKRKARLGKIFRRVFLPEEGMDWWEMDYKQCEYRLFAHFAKCERLIKGYNEEDIDMHEMVAILLGIDRDKGKNMNFGILYGMGIKALANHLGVSLQEAKRLLDAYFQMIPEAGTFMREAGNVARYRGYIRTLLGRRRRYVNPAKQSYQAINSICQGGNADIMKIKMIEVDDFLRSSGKGVLAFSVHDAINAFFPANDIGTAEEIMAICRNFSKEEQGFELRTRMDLDQGHGANWAIATYKDLREAA